MQRLKFSALVNGIKKQDVDRKFAKVKTLSYQLWMRKTLTRIRALKQSRGWNVFHNQTAECCRIFPHLCHETTTISTEGQFINMYVLINSDCSDRFQWQRAWITRDARARGFLLTTATTLLFGSAETHGFSERNNLGSVFTVLFLKSEKREHSNNM